jgi:hypothetical protein
MSLYRITPPEMEPVFLEEAKQFIRYEDSDQDAVIHGLIRSCREELEGPHGLLGRALMTSTWRWTLDEFRQPDALYSASDAYLRDRGHPTSASGIKLPVPPLQSISAITYLDANDAEQTLDPSVYRVRGTGGPGRGVLELKTSQSWPSLSSLGSPITIDFVAGYGNANEVPEVIRQGILVMVAHRFQNRERGVFSSWEELPDLAEMLHEYRAIYEDF